MQTVVPSNAWREAAMASNVEKIRVAYEIRNDTKGANRQVWLDLASDDFEMHSVAPRPQGLQFAGEQIGLAETRLLPRHPD